MAETVKIVCSCIPGFENIALKECKKRLNIEANKDLRGRINLEISIDRVTELLKLRAIHHYWVVVSDLPEYFADKNITKDEQFVRMNGLPKTLDWGKALKTWKIFKLFLQNNKKTDLNNDDVQQSKKPKIDDDSKTVDVPLKEYSETLNPADAGDAIGFRVTATRSGEHCFSSMESAVHLGAGVNEMFNWKVDLKQFDIEVVAFTLDTSLSIGIQLTKNSQSLRNITHFGPTTLKPNISYCLLDIADIQEGSIVCDPMCGGGSISLEATASFTNSFQICGDNHETAVQYAGDNFSACCQKKRQNFTLPFSVLRWDVYQLPLRTGCVDRIVTDLPFGKKIGSKERNMFLYPRAMDEMARICRPCGKAVLLTQHKQAMWKAIGKSHWWKLLEKRVINMGGMNVSVWLLGRTKEPFSFDKVKTTKQVEKKAEPQVKIDTEIQHES